MTITQDKKTFITGSFYGLLQIILLEAGMISSDGSPLPNKMLREASFEDMEILWLYKWCGKKISHLSKDDLVDTASYFNAASNSLLDVYEVDNTLLAIHLISKWVEEYSNFAESALLAGKLERSTKSVIAELCETLGEETGRKISKSSAYSADNLYRIMSGEAQLTMKEREAFVSRWNIPSREKEKNNLLHVDSATTDKLGKMIKETVDNGV